MDGDKLDCPKCKKVLEIDSIREYTNGNRRTYWECDNCNLSIMHRGGTKEGKN
jgi:phage FluMu protein Com